MANKGRRMVFEEDIKKINGEVKPSVDDFDAGYGVEIESADDKIAISVDNEVIASQSDLQSGIEGVQAEIDAKCPRVVESMNFDFTAYTVDAENQKLDVTGILDSLVLIKTNTCSASFVEQHGAGIAVEMDSGNYPDKEILAKGCFLLVDDRNASKIQYTILVTGNTTPEVGLNPDTSKCFEKELLKIGNNDFYIKDSRVFKYLAGIVVPNDYSGYHLVMYGKEMAAYDDIRIILLNNTGQQDTSTISSEFTKNPEGIMKFKYGYSYAGGNQPNFNISAVPSTAGTYVLKATVDSNGVFNGFSWVAEE